MKFLKKKLKKESSGLFETLELMLNENHYSEKYAEFKLHLIKLYQKSEIHTKTAIKKRVELMDHSIYASFVMVDKIDIPEDEEDLERPKGYPYFEKPE